MSKQQPSAHCGQKILVVDDHMEIRDILHIHLTGHGYHVTLAINGYDAMKKVVEGPFDLIITDISMPGICGNELYHAIRESSPGNSPPVIAITSEPWLAKAPFTDVVPKPFLMRDIDHAINNILPEPQSTQIRSSDQE